jgi:hypothetical protein
MTAMNQEIFDVIGTNVSDLEVWVYKIPLLEMGSVCRLVLSDTAADVSQYAVRLRLRPD